MRTTSATIFENFPERGEQVLPDIDALVMHARWSTETLLIPDTKVAMPDIKSCSLSEDSGETETVYGIGRRFH